MLLFKKSYFMLVFTLGIINICPDLPVWYLIWCMGFCYDINTHILKEDSL